MNKLKEIWSNKWVKFGVVSVLYLLWFVVWTGNPWMLLGLLVIYDVYISKFMYRLFWKRHKEYKKTHSGYRKTAEWVEAIVFATVAAMIIRTFVFAMYVIPTPSMEKSLLVGDYLYVSKAAYGPKMPNTPLAFPLVHHTLPFSQTKKSFVEWIKWPYHRLAGFGKVERDDAVVFNFPEGDTVIVDQQGASYYEILRGFQQQFGEKAGRDMLWDQSEIIYRPVDKRENYIKRAIGLPGDTIEIVHSEVFINGQPENSIENKQFYYRVGTNGTPIKPDTLEKMGIAKDDISYNSVNHTYQRLPLTSENLAKIKGFTNVVEVIKREAQGPESYIFPHDSRYPWNEDNFGPLWVPKKGATVPLTPDNLPLYERIIETYEGNKLEVKDGLIYINGAPADKYTFGMDYYFMMGDNRHNSADSRFWGFVPEDHIEGKASFVWLSLDKDKSFFDKIRWNRFFKKVR